MDYSSGSSADSEDKFAQLLWSQFDLALWFQRALWIAALVSVGDIAWEFHTGVVDVYSKVSSYTANRATHPDAFQRLVSLEVYRTIGIVMVGAALVALRRSVAHYDIFALGQEFKSLDEEGKS